MMHNLKNRKGFTLVELIIVILVVVLLAAFLIPLLSSQQNQAKEDGVHTDFHTFYIAAKSAIITCDNKAETKEEFIARMNEYLDNKMKINPSTSLSPEKDPWGHQYRFFWYHNNSIDNTWIAFTSEGVNAMPGWIFEPDNPSNVKIYSRDGIETYDNRYIMILGYPYLESIPESPTAEVKRSTEIPKILQDSESRSRKYVRLSFLMEEDEIELETTESLDSESNYLYFTNDPEDTGDGGGYVYSNGSALGWVDNWVNTYPGNMGSISLGIRNPGIPTITYANWVSNSNTSSTPNAYYPYESSINSSDLYSGGSVSADKFNNWLNSQKMKLESSSVVGDKTSVTLDVGKGNRIVVTFNTADKIAEDVMWFEAGSEVTIQAIPHEDYTFQYWKIDGSIDVENPKTLTVNEDTTFVAKFRMALNVNGSGRLTTPSGSSLSDYIDANEFYLSKANGTYTSTDSLWTYSVSNNKATLTNYNGPNGAEVDLVVPHTIDGIQVDTLSCISNITDKTFNKVTIEKGVKLAALAFIGAKITDLYIGKNVSLSSESSQTFFKAKITKLELHSNPVHRDEFSDTGITTLILGPEVTSITTCAFYNNPISNTPDFSHLDTIGINAFGSNSDSYVTVFTGDLVFKDGVSIGDYAFYNYYSKGQTINSITLKNATVGQSAFGINTINKVTIDNTSLGSSAFCYAKITDLYIGKNVSLSSEGSQTFYKAKITKLELHSNPVQRDEFSDAGITTLILGSEVTSITTGAFYNNPITSIYVDQPEGNLAGSPWGTTATVTWKTE